MLVFLKRISTAQIEHPFGCHYHLFPEDANPMATFKPLGARAVAGLFGFWLILLAISVCCAFAECLCSQFKGTYH